MSNVQAFLRVVYGDDKGKGWELSPRQVYRLGRSRKCNLRLRDSAVSGTHASLECRNDVWFVTDLASTHGTKVNRQPITGEKPLFDRDSLHVGKSVLEFREHQPLDPADLAEAEKGIELPE
jgi:pSer/pThr/pTyr-binding forkhead associated (FHA) protein